MDNIYCRSNAVDVTSNMQQNHSSISMYLLIDQSRLSMIDLLVFLSKMVERSSWLNSPITLKKRMN